MATDIPLDVVEDILGDVVISKFTEELMEIFMGLEDEIFCKLPNKSQIDLNLHFPMEIDPYAVYELIANDLDLLPNYYILPNNFLEDSWLPLIGNVPSLWDVIDEEHGYNQTPDIICESFDEKKEFNQTPDIIYDSPHSDYGNDNEIPVPVPCSRVKHQHSSFEQYQCYSNFNNKQHLEIIREDCEILVS